MLYNEEYILSKIRNHEERLIALESRVGSLIYIVSNGPSSGGFMLRDTPSINELPPSDITKYWILSFRDSSPFKVWDPTANSGNGAWLV